MPVYVSETFSVLHLFLYGEKDLVDGGERRRQKKKARYTISVQGPPCDYIGMPSIGANSMVCPPYHLLISN